jgi:hypothetical protein
MKRSSPVSFENFFLMFQENSHIVCLGSKYLLGTTLLSLRVRFFRMLARDTVNQVPAIVIAVTP